MKHELLVPVGNKESLIYAINNGADAVYLAGKKYGARAFAENFTLEEIEEATNLCHLYGVKIFITVNTLIYESEFSSCLEYIEYWCSFAFSRIGVFATRLESPSITSATLPSMSRGTGRSLPPLSVGSAHISG